MVRSRMLRRPLYAAAAITTAAFAPHVAWGDDEAPTPAVPPTSHVEGTPPAVTAPAPSTSVPPPEPAPLPQPAPVRTPSASAPTAPSPPVVQAPDAPCPAPSRPARGGFYIKANASLGFIEGWGSGPAGSASIASLATGGQISIGGRVAPGLALAGVTSTRSGGGTFHGGPPVTIMSTHVTNGVPVSSTATRRGHSSVDLLDFGGLVDWVPAPTKGWHLGASVGFAVVQVTDDADQTMGAIAPVGSVFGGYDWWLVNKLAGEIQMTFMGTPSVSLSDSNSAGTGYRFATLAVTVDAGLVYF